MFNIIALLPFFYICNRVRANSYTAIDFSIGVMAYHDDIGSTCCQRLISCTKDDIVGNIICQDMIIADDNQIIVFLSFFSILLA